MSDFAKLCEAMINRISELRAEREAMVACAEAARKQDRERPRAFATGDEMQGGLVEEWTCPKPDAAS